MNEYRINLVDAEGTRQNDHIQARTAQEAADRIRKEWKGCHVVLISQVVHDWE